MDSRSKASAAASCSAANGSLLHTLETESKTGFSLLNRPIRSLAHATFCEIAIARLG